MVTSCPNCGALLENSITCQEMFDEFLSLEFSDSAYGRVHMLTVTCYMIQHQRYSDMALAWMKDKLDEVLNKGVSPEEIRIQMTRDAAQTNRDWKIESQPDEREFPKIEWSITIADVYMHKDDPISYCNWVVRWASATLEEMTSQL